MGYFNNFNHFRTLQIIYKIQFPTINMGSEKYMLLSLEDSKMKSLSEVLGSKTCKKIIDYLGDNKEASQKDLSDALKIPMNTMEYNMKKLLTSGVIQKRKNFFWSKKGKKIIMYELSNKSIVISPKKSSTEKLKSILPAVIITIGGTFAVYAYEKITGLTNHSYDSLNSVVARKAFEEGGALVQTAPDVAFSGTEKIREVATDATIQIVQSSTSQHSIWPWFLFGGILAIGIILMVNWRKL